MQTKPKILFQLHSTVSWLNNEIRIELLLRYVLDNISKSKLLEEFSTQLCIQNVHKIM